MIQFMMGLGRDSGTVKSDIDGKPADPTRSCTASRASRGDVGLIAEVTPSGKLD